jgi:hypothetical protein
MEKFQSDDTAHSKWHIELAKLLGCNVDDIVGYVVIAATRDHQITVDTNSKGGEGAILLIDEARKVISKEADEQ